jgi:hypothetical protein
VSLALGVFIYGISRESEQRHAAIVALERAQAESELLLEASLAVSRARIPDEVVAAVGECLASHEVDSLAVWSGDEQGELLARWPASRPASERATIHLDLAPSTTGDHTVLAVATVSGDTTGGNS